MRKTHLFAAVAAVAFAGQAQAQVSGGFAPGGASPGPGYTVIWDFDTTLPAGFAPSATVQIKSPPNDGDGARPGNSTFPGVNYLSVLAFGSVDLNFAAPVTSFQFDWGSIDAYNALTIFSTSDSSVIDETIFSPANGAQSGSSTNGLFTATAIGSTMITGFRLTSTGNSFEIDNVAVRGAVPEPATWAMMIGGFGFVGGAMRRRAKLRVACSV